jgi:hypothetical protein
MKNQDMNSGMTTAAASFGALPLFSFSPAWVEQSAAFVHPDARLGKAFIKLLMAAWRSCPAGTIPASHQYIADATNLSLEVVDEHYTTLTDGFVLQDGRLRHAQMGHLLDTMAGRFGKALEEFALSSAMAVQDPDQFSLIAVEAASAKAKGKTKLPKGFGFEAHPELIEWASLHGFPQPEDRAWIMEKFIDYSLKKDSRWVNWASAFRNWSTKELEFGSLPPSRAAAFPARKPATSPFSRFVDTSGASKGEVARDHNADVFATLNHARPVSAEAMRGGSV